MNNWIQTKREKRSLQGEHIITTTEEPNTKKRFSEGTKDIIDISVKIIGAASIFVPLFLLYYQYSHEISKQKNEKLSDIFANASFDIQAVKNYNYGTSEFKNASENLLFKYPARIAVFKIESLNLSYHDIVGVFDSYQAVKAVWSQLDFINSGYNNIWGSHSFSKTTVNGVTKKFELRFLDMTEAEKLKQVDRYLNASKDSINVTPNLFEKLNQIPGVYSSDTILAKILMYVDSAYKSYGDIYDDLLDLRAYLIDKKIAYTEDLEIGPYYFESRGLADMLAKIRICKNRLEKLLDDARENFQSQTLKFISD